MHESLWVPVFSWEVNVFGYADGEEMNVSLTSGGQGDSQGRLLTVEMPSK